MGSELREHLVVFAIVSVVGVVAGALAFMFIRNSMAQMSYGTYSLLTVVVPCVIMFVCSFVIVATAKRIGAQLYGGVVVVCLLAGLVSVVVSSIWVLDPTVAATLQANSEPGTEIVPAINSMLVVVRNATAFFVVATVGSILGAMIGSRLHAMSAVSSGRPKRKKRRFF